ncbi:MAG: flagellar hook capping FlgD N-terminal domain-containing protein [Thermoguttaceae bacterium]
MSTSSITSPSSGASTSLTTTNDAFEKVDLNDFIKLLVAELQNQDPLNPMDNSELLQQVSQIKAIESNQRLSDTLSYMQLQQNVATGGSLLQKTVSGLSDDGKRITGVVESVTIDNDGMKVNLGNQTISLKNITSIEPTNT